MQQPLRASISGESKETAQAGWGYLACCGHLACCKHSSLQGLCWLWATCQILVCLVSMSYLACGFMAHARALRDVVASSPGLNFTPRPLPLCCARQLGRPPVCKGRV